MSSMMRLILGLGALFLILVAVALGLPAHVTVSRSVVINAPDHVIYPYLNNLRRFAEWSPWAARDPNMKVTYSGPQEGQGAKVEWASDEPSIGTGSMEIVNTEAPRNIDLAVNYNGLVGTGYYDISPAGAGASGSKVTWSFGFETGSSPLKRWKGLVLDGLVGAEYSKGLEKLRARVEGDRRPTAQPAVMPPQVPPAAEAGEPPANAPGETVVKQAPAQAQGANPPPPPPRR